MVSKIIKDKNILDITYKSSDISEINGKNFIRIEPEITSRDFFNCEFI